MKKLVSILLAVLLCATCFAVAMVPASAGDGGKCGENVTWGLDNQGNLIISGTGPMTNYTASNPSPFYNRSDIVNVTIEEGVTTVGDCVFSKCRYMESVSIPKSVTRVGWHAFWYCTSLDYIRFEKNCKTIDRYACANCSKLKTVSLQGGTTIGEGAFAECNKIDTVVYYGTESEWNSLNPTNNGPLVNCTPTYIVSVTYVAGPGGFVDEDKSTVTAFVGKGEYMEVYATPAEGYRFVGWYNGDEKISDQETQPLCPTENMTLTAKFEKIQTEPQIEPAPYCAWCGGHHDNAGLIEMIIGWFHGILAMLLGARY